VTTGGAGGQRMSIGVAMAVTITTGDAATTTVGAATTAAGVAVNAGAAVSQVIGVMVQRDSRGTITPLFIGCGDSGVEAVACEWRSG
jgi:ApbE superfamily uncharacterized protein (UPF0280 family)